MPTIASSSSPPQRPPPGDADLQDLYNQVLSAFAEESSPSNFSPTYSINRSNNVDHDPHYSPHSDEGVSSLISSRTHPQSRGSFSCTPSFSPLIPPPHSACQSPRQQPSPPLSDSVSHLAYPGQGPSSLTKTSWRLTHQPFHLPFSHARTSPLLPRSCPLHPHWCQAWRRAVRHFSPLFSPILIASRL